MAMNDIVPYTGIGAGGGTVRIGWFQIGTAVPAQTGEPVVVAADGQMDECADNPVLVAGIAQGVPENAFTGGVGVTTQFLNFPFVNGLNPDRAPQAGDPLPVVLATPDQYFLSRQLLSTGSALTLAPVLANIGDVASLDLIGTAATGAWGLLPLSGNQICTIVDVLDAQGRSLSLGTGFGTPGAGVFTVFKFNSGMQF